MNEFYYSILFYRAQYIKENFAFKMTDWENDSV